MNISALSHYQRVITTKRPGTCHTCEAPTVEGRDYAAVNGNRQWFAFCQACAASYAAQVAALVKRAEAHAATIDPALLADFPLPNEQVMIRIMQGKGTPVEGYDIVHRLFALLALAPADPLFDQLRAIAADPAATPRNRSFAEDLVAYSDRTGRLTDNQRKAAEGMVARLAGGSNPTGAPAVGEGVYVNAAGVFVKVQRSKAGRLYGKVFTGRGWDYQPNLANDTSLRPITADEAAAYGHQWEACIFCGRALTDDGDNRSVMVGYGPVCGPRHGLPWG